MMRLDHGHGQDHAYVTSGEDSPYTKPTVLDTGHGVAHAYVTKEGGHDGRTAGKGKPRRDAPELARRADPADQGSSRDVAPDSGRDADGGDARGTLRALSEHPKVARDLKKLPRKIQQTYHERVDGLRRGEAHPSTHALTGPLKGWQGTNLDFLNRVVHRSDGDQLHVLSVGNHDEAYDSGIRRNSRFEHDLDRCQSCFGRGEFSDGSECGDCDGSGRRECPCGLQVAYDPQDGFQHLDGSISHYGDLARYSVSDLMDMGRLPKHLDGSTRTASIRMVPPEEFKNFSFPDYPKAKTPDALVKHFQKTSPEYYNKIKDDVQKNGFSTPVLVRWHDPRGKPLKKPQLMTGHHRAAVAHELGIPLPVGDHASQEDFDTAFQGERAWFAENQRPTHDMPHEGRYTAPTKRLFGPTFGLDTRIWDGEKLRKSIRDDIIGRFDAFCARHGYADWRRWAKIVFFGSEASEWTSKSLHGNNDFDLSIGIHYPMIRISVPHFGPAVSDTEISDTFTQQMHAELNDPQHRFPGVDGIYDQTWYANHLGWDITQIRPYAAYDVVANDWIVKPPHLEDWSLKSFPEGEGLAEQVHGIILMAEGILAMPEPYRTQNGAALWHFVHDNRSDAFGENGEGWWDARNVIEKALDQKGLMQQLWALMDRAKQDPSTLRAPAGWSNDPGSGGG
jgi:hypothetical protein